MGRRAKDLTRKYTDQDDEKLKEKAPEEGSDLTYSQEYYILKREEIL